MPEAKALLVTGGCGFIGSNFIRKYTMERRGTRVINLDALTYAGNPENVADLESTGLYSFVKGSIDDAELVDRLARESWAIVNFAAESHVDRSLYGPREFVSTNVQGTLTLLEAAKRHKLRFLQISTDEVYGSLGSEGKFSEESPIHPNNPYAATKAAADHLALSYARSFGMDVVVTRSSNNYGPRQYPEKFIPLLVTNALDGKNLPIYGDGGQIRDWLHVYDNVEGVMAVLDRGRAGEVYNLGGEAERKNIDVAAAILRLVQDTGSQFEYVTDRPGHDRRYAIDCKKAWRELHWAPKRSFDEGLRETVDWYRTNRSWVARIKSGAFKVITHGQAT
jgi:dTDP-glucose 4,6-dehydratase